MHKLGMDQSQYSGRESGQSSISKKEWDTLAKALKEIYEPHDWLYIINNENANGNFGNYNVYNNQADFAFETMKKYIEKREVENQQLKEENEQLKTR